MQVKSDSNVKDGPPSLGGPAPMFDAATVKAIAGINWSSVGRQVNAEGFAVVPEILSREQCDMLVSLYDDAPRFRSRIVMERYAFGRGEYKYFGHPLPDLVTGLRRTIYRHLAPIANEFHERMGLPERFPPDLAAFSEICKKAGQVRPTPLMLRYGPGDYCCLHQDLYGEHVFPFQVVFLLAEPGRDFEGGEFMLIDSDPKWPGRAEVVPLSQGDAVVIAVNSRPQPGARGYYRVRMRHGVSELRSGHRQTLGIIFHDSK